MQKRNDRVEFTCDRCGFDTETHGSLPPGWGSIHSGAIFFSRTEADLCPMCMTALSLDDIMKPVTGPTVTMGE